MTSEITPFYEMNERIYKGSHPLHYTPILVLKRTILNKHVLNGLDLNEKQCEA